MMRYDLGRIVDAVQIRRRASPTVERGPFLFTDPADRALMAELAADGP